MLGRVNSLLSLPWWQRTIIHLSLNSNNKRSMTQTFKANKALTLELAGQLSNARDIFNTIC